MIGVHLVDGLGSKQSAGIDSAGAVSVALQIGEVPPIGTKNQLRFYTAKLGSTGANGGVVNLNVNGSVTPQEFYVSSHPDCDLYIGEITILIADTAVTHNNFGAIAALTNGVDIIITESGEATYLIQAAKTGGQLIAQSGFHYGYGNGAESWELVNWTGISDAQTIVIPMNEYIPGGLRIGRGTLDRLSVWVRDDLTGLTEFTVKIIGHRHCI